MMQTPAGIITARVSSRRVLFAVAVIVTGLCFVAVPIMADCRPAVDAVLFASRVAQSFFAPLLGAPALALVGHQLLNRIAGTNRSSNHAGGTLPRAGAADGASQLPGNQLGFLRGGDFIHFGCGVGFPDSGEDLDERVASGLNPPGIEKAMATATRLRA
jgi:hypothetical protein